MTDNLARIWKEANVARSNFAPPKYDAKSSTD
jgi:hypothetical protein